MDVVQSLNWSHEQLVKLNVPHALIGGMALSEYGYGRGTQDVDWLIPEEFSMQVADAFIGAGFQIFHQTADVLQLSGKAEIDFIIARRPISRKMIEEAHYSDQLKMPVVLAEDLIGLKIQCYAGNPKRKNKELSDIQELIDRCENLNWEKIKFYADHFQEWETIEKLKQPDLSAD
jgi:hypothetical protein